MKLESKCNFDFNRIRKLTFFIRVLNLSSRRDPASEMNVVALTSVLDGLQRFTLRSIILGFYLKALSIDI